MKKQEIKSIITITIHNKKSLNPHNFYITFSFRYNIYHNLAILRGVYIHKIFRSYPRIRD
jgi:hypothetical protein